MLQTNKFDLNTISGVQDISDIAAEKCSGGVSDARAAFLARRAEQRSRLDALRAQAVSGTNVSSAFVTVTATSDEVVIDGEIEGNVSGSVSGVLDDEPFTFEF